MLCKKCGKELSENSKFCSECGEKIEAEDKGNMQSKAAGSKKNNKRSVSILTLIGVLIAAVVVASGINYFKNKNILEGKYYVGNANFAGHVIYFEDENIVKLLYLGLGKEDEVVKYYGVYMLDGRELSINILGEEELTGIVINDGDKLTIDGEPFERIKSKDLDKKAKREFNEP